MPRQACLDLRGDRLGTLWRRLPKRGCTAERVRSRDPLDEFLRLAVDPRAAETSTTRPPGPVPLEASSVPADHGLGLNEDQSFPPPSPEARQPCPEQPVGEADLRALGLLAQRGQLLPQREVL